jgi:hypothetical protein
MRLTIAFGILFAVAVTATVPPALPTAPLATSSVVVSYITHGLVSVLVGGSIANGTIGTVCSEGFDVAKARLICSKMSYPVNSSQVQLFVSVDPSPYGDSTPIYQLSCGVPGDLSTCYLSPAPANCTHQMDVWVNCPVARTSPARPQLAGISAVSSSRFEISTTRTRPLVLQLRPVASPAWGLLCAADAADFSAAAADAVCMKLDANNIAGYPVLNSSDRSRFVSSFPVYATALSCARGADFADCVVHPAPDNTVLATRANCTPAEVECVPLFSARGSHWSTTIADGSLQVRYAENLPYIPICGSAVNWNVAVAAGRQMASAGAIVDDVIVNMEHAAAPRRLYTGARVKYDCGKPSDANAPRNLDACAVQRYPEGAYCEVAASIDADGVRWEFASLGVGSRGEFIAASPRPARSPFRHIALSFGFVVTDETLEVACRSIGLSSSFFTRKAYAVDSPDVQGEDIVASYGMVDPVCDDGAIPALNRCRYRYTTADPAAPRKVLAVDCRVWPLWFLVTIPVLGAFILAAAVLGCVYCGRRHRAARRRRFLMLDGDFTKDIGTKVVDLDVEKQKDSPSAAAYMSNDGNVASERKRWQAIVRGHAVPTAETFSFGFLRIITDSFTRSVYTTHEMVPAGDAVFFECSDIASGLVHTGYAAISIMPVDTLDDLRASFLTAARLAADVTKPEAACCPALYGMAVADAAVDDLTRIAQLVGLPQPPAGSTFVALLSEAPAPHTVATTVVGERVVKPPEMQRAAGWIARTVRTLGSFNISASSHPMSVCLRGGTPIGAPFPSRVWFVPAAPYAHVALRNGLVAFEREAAVTVVSSTPCGTLSELVEKLEAAGDMKHNWVPRYPFHPDAECPLRVQASCVLCGAMVAPVGCRIAALRCASLRAHVFCHRCVTVRLDEVPMSSRNAPLPCACLSECRGVWLPDDHNALVIFHDSTVLATVVHESLDADFHKPFDFDKRDEREDVTPVSARAYTGHVLVSVPSEPFVNGPDAPLGTVGDDI